MREKPKDRGRLLHIKEAIDNIKEFKENISLEDFKKDKLRYFAIVKNLEIVGEAAYMLTQEFQETHKNLPWKDIVRMRHILVHGYYHIEPEIIWETIINDIDSLYSAIISFLAEGKN